MQVVKKIETDVLDQAERWEELINLCPNYPIESNGQNFTEKNILFSQLVYRALDEGIIGESKAAELLALSTFEFHLVRKLKIQDTDVN